LDVEMRRSCLRSNIGHARPHWSCGWAGPTALSAKAGTAGNMYVRVQLQGEQR
jgi:hypothetical protein